MVSIKTSAGAPFRGLITSSGPLQVSRTGVLETSRRIHPGDVGKHSWSLTALEHGVSVSTNVSATVIGRAATAAPEPSMPAYTWLTVYFEADQKLMTLQARTMGMFLPPSAVREILVIDNSERGDFRMPWYGPHADKVRVMRRWTDGGGWFSQQILKLEAAKHVATSRYVVLDAKTHLLRPPRPDHFETKSGVLRTSIDDYSDHPLRRDVEGVLSYWKMPYRDKFYPCHTPICLDRALTLAMLEEMKGDVRKMLNEHRATDFLMYWAYLAKRGHKLDESGPRTGGIWNNHSDKDIDWQIDAIKRENRPFFSLHRRSLPFLSLYARKRLRALWHGSKIPEAAMPF